jgi:branched-chain amino acid transport system substrate-binding protein
MKKKEIFKKVVVISLSIMLALVIFVGFSLAQEKEIRIGAIVDLSGPLSQFGPDWLKAGEMAAKEINSLGGLFDQQIKLYVEDGKTDVEEGVKAAKKLIPINKVIAIYGPTSDIVVGIMDFCADNKVPVISGVSGSSRLDKIGGKYQYRTCPSDSYEGVADAAFAYDELGLKNVSLITADEEGTLSVSGAFKETYEKLGGKILKDVLISPGQATYMSSIQLAFEPKPEGLLLSANMDVAATVIKEWLRAGYGGKIMCGSDIGPGKFVDLVGKKNVEGVYYTTIASDPNTVSYKSFDMKWKALTGSEPGYGVPNCYDAMVLYGLAIQAAGKATGEGIAENMRKVANPPGIKVYSFAEGKEQLLLGNDIDYEGASGPCDFDEYGNVAGGFSKYVFDSNGEGVLVKYYPAGSLK